MNPTFKTLPATCELCGNWLPGHSVCYCRRNYNCFIYSLQIANRSFHSDRLLALEMVYILVNGALVLMK